MGKETSIDDEITGVVSEIKNSEKPNDTIKEESEEEKKSIKELELYTSEERKNIEKKPQENESFETEEETLPPIYLPAPQCAFFNEISAFGFSQQGASHVSKNVACQDRSGFKVINDKILVAAIADGVGSCALSNYGADTAVNAALDYLEQYYTVEMKKDNFVFDDPIKMGKMLRDMMDIANQSVDKKADDLEQLPFSFQSTLTVAVYDGSTLFFAHAGDDGIVAMSSDGTYELVTQRHKGEEANSVYPLQSSGTRQFGKVSNTVAFVMVTDGVLDAFVRPSSEGNRVFFPFVESIFYRKGMGLEETEQVCTAWFEYMNSDKFRKTVTDDVSLIGVVNQKSIESAVKPQFSIEEWDRQNKEYIKKRNEYLYSNKEKTEKKKEKRDDQAIIENQNGVIHKKPNRNRDFDTASKKYEKRPLNSKPNKYENKLENDEKNIIDAPDIDRESINNNEIIDAAWKCAEITANYLFNTGIEVGCKVSSKVLKKVADIALSGADIIEKSVQEKKQNNSKNAETNKIDEERKL